MSGIVAICIMRHEILQNRKEKKEEKISKFIDYLIEHEGLIIERVEQMSYFAIEAVGLSKNDESDMLLVNKFLNAKRLARTAAFNVMAQLKLKKDDDDFRNDKIDSVYKQAENLFDDINDYESIVLQAKKTDEMEMKRTELYDLTNNLCDAIQEYTKELSETKF